VIDRSLNYGRDVMARFLRESRPFRSVLDLGAGFGYDLGAAGAAEPACERWGVEKHPAAQKELASQGVRVIDGDLERDRLPLDDESMDVVMMNQVLEHAKEVFWILHESSRVLKPGGSLLIGVPNLASLHNRLLLALGRQPTSLAMLSAHLRGFTRGDVERFLAGTFPGGYARRSFAGSNFYPFPPFLARPLARVLPGMAWGIFFRFTKERAYRGEILRYLETNPLETTYWKGPQAS
jgi:SAM-dependent methyltransferase